MPVQVLTGLAALDPVDALVDAAMRIKGQTVSPVGGLVDPVELPLKVPAEHVNLCAQLYCSAACQTLLLSYHSAHFSWILVFGWSEGVLGRRR